MASSSTRQRAARIELEALIDARLAWRNPASGDALPMVCGDLGKRRLELVGRHDAGDQAGRPAPPRP